MAAPTAPMLYDKAFVPETGRPVGVVPGLVRVTAPNAGPYAFTGTNSFIIGHDDVALLDPGPDDPAHLAALRVAIGGRRLIAILLTHTHRDHSDLVRRLVAETGAPVWFGGQHRLSRPARPFERNAVGRESDFSLVPDRTLRDGERLTLGGVGLEVIATPGHCANHLSFALTGTLDLLSGDHVMGWSSTLVSVPDGAMADYLQSLERLIALPYARYIPAHGGPIADGPGYARALLAHRRQRNVQVLDAVAAGANSIGALRARIYPDLALNLIPAARMTLRAHIEYLADQGLLRLRQTLFGLRIAR